MKISKVASIYSFIIGIAMIGMWTIFLITGQVPELQTEPARIVMHLIAEFSTAIILIIGGFGLITKKTWAVKLHQFSLGMLMYTLIVSPGYYLQLGDVAMVGMFGTMFVLTVTILIFTYTKSDEF